MMKKWIISALLLLSVAPCALAQRFSFEYKPREYSAREKEAIEAAKKAEKQHAGLASEGKFIEGDFGDGLEVRKYRDHIPAERRAQYEADMKEMEAMMSNDIPAEYSWILPEGKKTCDVVAIENGEVSIALRDRTEADYKKAVDRVKAHGYTLDANTTTFGGMVFYEARSPKGIQATVLLNKSNLMISFTPKKD